MNKEYTDRIEWLDVAKGLTIILMVLGHTSIPDVLSRFIYSFHMPLFFIASGWTTKWKHSIASFIEKKFKTILLPFVLYSFVVLFIMSMVMDFSFSQWLRTGWGGYALWFIPVLFFASLIGRVIWLIRYRIIRMLAMLLCLLLGAMLNHHDIYLPWALSSVPFASFLVLLGTELKEFTSSLVEMPKMRIIMLCFLVTLVISHFWKLDVAWNNILPVIPLTIGAVCGTLMMFGFSSYIVRLSCKLLTNSLKAIGKETYVILAFSQIIMMMLNEFTPFNAMVRYLVLVVALLSIICLKNSIRTLFL